MYDTSNKNNQAPDTDTINYIIKIYWIKKRNKSLDILDEFDNFNPELKDKELTIYQILIIVPTPLNVN